LSVHNLARIFVLCARAGPGPEARGEALRLAASIGDWSAALGMAEREGILPLLYWNLRDDPGAVPAAVLESLRLSYLRNLARNSLAYKELEVFLEAVRRAGVRAALTKGGRLALDIYPDIALRPFWDVDFFVHPSDWPALKRILAGLGFTEATGVSEGGPADAVLDWTYSPYFRQGALFLEFHFGSFGLHLAGVPAADPWPSTCRLPVRGTEAMILPAAHELCYLAIHAQQHSYTRLIWLADIAEFAARPGLDWDRVVRVCRAEKVMGPVYHGLHLASTLWPGSIPSGPLTALRPGPVERAALRFLWSDKAMAARNGAPAWPYYMPSLFSLWERRSPALAARTLRAILFPPRTWLAAASGVAANSPRLFGRYVKRLLSPAVTAVRRLIRTP
jgi:hypothetical protein